jgi:hypothetical protein
MPQQSPAPIDVEVIERGGDLLSEAEEPAAEPVLCGKLGATAAECVLLLGELVAACGERGCAPGELVELEQARPVGVEQLVGSRSLLRRASSTRLS